MELFIKMGVSIGLGLIIGLQRERMESRLGGIRTYPLISLLGTFCGWLGNNYGAWIVAAGLVAVVAALAVSNFVSARQGQGAHGQTSEFAALLTFAIGAYLVQGSPGVAMVGAGIVVLLLHLRETMHEMVKDIGHKDMAAIMHLVVISLIVLPILPDRTFGPLDVLNPFDIWLMVVLIVSISLGGYIAFKVLGGKVGTLLGGILGGVISSTATTISFARRIRGEPQSWNLALVAIVIAGAVSYLRVIVEVAVITPKHLGQMAPPLVAMFLWMTLLSVLAYFLFRGKEDGMPAPTNPAELRTALIFGAIYAVVLFAVAGIRHYFGQEALYGVALVSGLVNMDALTLSISRMVENSRVEPMQGWRLILAASFSNLVFKALAVGFLANWHLAGRIGLFFGAGLGGGLLLAFLWP